MLKAKTKANSPRFKREAFGKKIKAKMGNKMNEGMLMPYKKLLDSIPAATETDNPK